MVIYMNIKQFEVKRNKYVPLYAYGINIYFHNSNTQIYFYDVKL